MPAHFETFKKCLIKIFFFFDANLITFVTLYSEITTEPKSI